MGDSHDQEERFRLNDDLFEERYRIFTQKALDVSLQHSRILVTLFSGIIAGLLALIIQSKLGFWSSTCFLLADGFAVIGLGFCLLHFSFTSKVLFILAGIFGGEFGAPDVVSQNRGNIGELFDQQMTSAQRCYAGQLWFLFFAALFSGLGICCLLWDHVRAGLILVCFLFLVFGLGFAALVFFVLRTARHNSPGNEELHGSDGNGPQ